MKFATALVGVIDPRFSEAPPNRLGVHRGGNVRQHKEPTKVNIYLPQEDIDWFDREACAMGMNRSQYFRYSIRVLQGRNSI